MGDHHPRSRELGASELDAVLEALMTSARSGRLVLLRYDNPETPDDEFWRLVQPFRLVQTNSNLLALTWEYAPANDYRVLRLNRIVELKSTAYPGLFDSSAVFNLEMAIPWADVDEYTRRAAPFDRRLRSVRDGVLFYLDCMRAQHRDVRRLPSLPDLRHFCSRHSGACWSGIGLRSVPSPSS